MDNEQIRACLEQALAAAGEPLCRSLGAGTADACGTPAE